MNIRIAIIEDEYYTRQALRKYVEKLGVPYEYCGDAGDGRAGIELLRRLKPDIALVDITMPIMNGIEMMELAAEEQLPTRMIILTGYSDFSYARMAVHLGAGEYLLKPLRIEDLKQALEHVSRTLRPRENALPDGVDVQRLLRRQLAEQLTLSGTDSVDTLLLAEHLEFPQNTGVYHVALIESCDFSRSALKLPMLFQLILDSMQQQGFSAISYPADAHCLCLVIHLPQEVSPCALNDALKSISQSVHNAHGISLKISLSGPVPRLNMIPDACEEAQIIRQYMLFFSDQNIALYTLDNLSSTPYTPLSQEMRQTLAMLLRRKDAKAVESFILDRFDALTDASANAVSCYLCAAEMLSVILEYTAVRTKCAPDASSNVLPSLFSINHVESLKKFIIDRAMEAIGNGEMDENAHTMLIRRVNEYIEQNFGSSSLRLEDIAKANFISTQYLCSVYRRAIQSTIGDYIFEVRMRHARKMIGDGQRNVTTISEACGYDDPGYFCKCFRKKFGVTPKQYIESHMN